MRQLKLRPSLTALLLAAIFALSFHTTEANVLGSRYSPETLQAVQQAEAERVAKQKIATATASRSRHGNKQDLTQAPAGAAAGNDDDDAVVGNKNLNPRLRLPAAASATNGRAAVGDQQGKDPVAARGSSTLVDLIAKRRRVQQEQQQNAASSASDPGKDATPTVGDGKPGAAAVEENLVRGRDEARREQEQGGNQQRGAAAGGDKRDMPDRFAHSLLNAGRAVDLDKLDVDAKSVGANSKEESPVKSPSEVDARTSNNPQTVSDLLDELAKNAEKESNSIRRPANNPTPVDVFAGRPAAAAGSGPGASQQQQQQEQSHLLPPLVGQNLPAFRDPATRISAEHVPINRQIHRMNHDGSYTYGYESMDGFKLETRLPDGRVVGRYGYYDAEGKLNVVEYGANEKDGFVPKGDGINVPPTVTRSGQPSAEGGNQIVKVDFSGQQADGGDGKNNNVRNHQHQQPQASFGARPVGNPVPGIRPLHQQFPQQQEGFVQFLPPGFPRQQQQQFGPIVPGFGFQQQQQGLPFGVFEQPNFQQRQQLSPFSTVGFNGGFSGGAPVTRPHGGVNAAAAGFLPFGQRIPVGDFPSGPGHQRQPGTRFFPSPEQQQFGQPFFTSAIGPPPGFQGIETRPLGTNSNPQSPSTGGPTGQAPAGQDSFPGSRPEQGNDRDRNHQASQNEPNSNAQGRPGSQQPTPEQRPNPPFTTFLAPGQQQQQGGQAPEVIDPLFSRPPLDFGFQPVFGGFNPQQQPQQQQQSNRPGPPPGFLFQRPPTPSVAFPDLTQPGPQQQRQPLQEALTFLTPQEFQALFRPSSGGRPGQLQQQQQPEQQRRPLQQALTFLSPQETQGLFRPTRQPQGQQQGQRDVQQTQKQQGDEQQGLASETSNGESGAAQDGADIFGSDPSGLDFIGGHHPFVR